jgi:hypothetical protein
MPDEIQAAEPSSANEVPESPNTSELPAMTVAERHEWRLTGKLPTPPDSQDSAPAVSKDTSPAADDQPKDAPESGAGKETQDKPGHKPKLSAKERIEQLKSTIAKIEKEAGIETPKAEPSPAPQPPPKAAPKAEAKPAEYVPLDEEKYYAEHPDATLNDWIQAQVDHRSDWKEEQREVARTKAASEAKVAEEQATIRRNWEERTAAARKDHADFDDVAFAKDLDIPAGSVLDAWVLARPDGAKVLYALGKDRKELARISALDPLSQAAELRDLELKLSGKTPKEQPKATAKPVSAAPPPASSVSATDTAPEDAAKAAAEADDFPRFMREQNRKELARSGK